MAEPRERWAIFDSKKRLVFASTSKVEAVAALEHYNKRGDLNKPLSASLEPLLQDFNLGQAAGCTGRWICQCGFCFGKGWLI